MKDQLKSMKRVDLIKFIEGLKWVKENYAYVKDLLQEAEQLLDAKDKKLDVWYSFGLKDKWIKEANDPPFTKESFYECSDFEDMWHMVSASNWCLGKAFYCGEICLINSKAQGDDWLVFKADEFYDNWAVQAMGKEKFLCYLESVQSMTLRQYWSSKVQFRTVK